MNKKYYFIKIKETFFDEEEIRLLEHNKNGYLYTNIYLKLCLISLKNEGKLLLNESKPYTQEMLAILTAQSTETIKDCLKAFEDIGLIETLKDGTIYMTNIQKYIGSENSEAIRLREYRQRIKDAKEGIYNNKTQNLYERTQNLYKRTTEKELELELDTDTDTDTDIETEKEKEKEKDTEKEGIVKGGKGKGKNNKPINLAQQIALKHVDSSCGTGGTIAETI